MRPERVIRNRRVEADDWRILGMPDGDVGPELPAGPIAVPLATWLARRDELLSRRPVGVWLKPDDDPAALAPDLARVALIAVHFPRFTDGRGYSIASLLRRRHGYAGELRAFGDVGRDQLFYLARVGFDAFRLADHRDPEAALASLGDFSQRYQASVDEPAPLFRRRAAAPEGKLHG